jgi:hypothetical protein
MASNGLKYYSQSAKVIVTLENGLQGKASDEDCSHIPAPVDWLHYLKGHAFIPRLSVSVSLPRGRF